MRAESRRTLEGGYRAREHDRANPSTDANHRDVSVRLDERLNRADALAVQQRTGLDEAIAASTRRNQLQYRIHFSYLVPLGKVAKLASRTNPSLVGKFKLTRPNTSHNAFIVGARAALETALGSKEALLSNGLATTLLDDFAKAIAELDAESNAVMLSHRSHITARAELDTVIKDVTDLVNVLDGFNRYRYQADPEQLAAWNAARTIVSHTPRKTTPPADGTTKAA